MLNAAGRGGGRAGRTGRGSDDAFLAGLMEEIMREEELYQSNSNVNNSDKKKKTTKATEKNSSGKPAAAPSSSSTSSSTAASTSTGYTSFPSSSSKSQSQKTSQVIVGDRVLVHGKYPGRVAYVGDVHYAKGIFIGVIMDDSKQGKNKGVVKGVEYFSCAEHEKGLILPADEVKKLL